METAFNGSSTEDFPKIIIQHNFLAALSSSINDVVTQFLVVFGYFWGFWGGFKNEDNIKNEDNLKNEDELKNENDHKNEENLKIEDDLKIYDDLKN